jgi:hypothetical protein
MNFNFNKKVLSAAVGLFLLTGSSAIASMAQAKDASSSQVPTFNELFAPAGDSPLPLLEKSSVKRCFTSVTSQLRTSGLNQRSSKNFSLKGVKKFRVLVYQGGKLSTRIRFNVNLDRPAPQRDVIVGSNIGFGDYTYKGPTRPLYIASPKNAGRSPFMVKFCRL